MRLVSVVCAALILWPAGRLTAGAEVLRTVYFSAVDAKGVPVTDLTAADLAVKEGGKPRVISAVDPATAPMHVFILVDDGGTGAFQAAVSQFIDATLGHALFAISALNPQITRLTTFTGDVEVLKTAVGRIGPRGKIATVGEQMMGSVEQAAKELQQRKAARAAIVVLTVGGETPQSDQADPALSVLKASGASLNVVYLIGIEVGKVLGDGPKRSGGMTQQVSAGVSLGPVLARFADTLLHQYVVTYTLPDGVKPNEKLALTTSRSGVTLIAPDRIPDK